MLAFAVLAATAPCCACFAPFSAWRLIAPSPAAAHHKEVCKLCVVLMRCIDCVRISLALQAHLQAAPAAAATLERATASAPAAPAPKW